MMLKEMKGRAVIIAISEFHPRHGEVGSLDQRKGVKRDVNRLFKVLSRLGYKVSLHMDVSAKEIKDIYQKESKMPQGESFISILSSHGNEGLIYDFYGTPVLLRDLYDILAPNNSPLLAGVPKLFFVQACRGEQFDEGVFLETDGDTCATDAFSLSLNLPRDSVLMFASSEGHVAFQNPGGSVFLQTLCNLLEGEERNLELNRILTRLAHMVAYTFQSQGQYGGFKEMPCYTTNLTRELYPFRQS
ncbi:hypothetical protein XENTR_v10009580 [Xenopus tropicalis]|nr:uncharacterized protein LOC733553 isoform X1 [Xenopus tropicalis]KAE8619049.1 hypothetical protein XENTR_v10009580 [Xenopus tropicalis]|eukprot:XP_017947618.1 PREDICTED: uncharacterized protein LOC733553 isoform X1 [Xenopus tropicalis]